ncbi:hypothetical protein [Cryptosporangium aurantiacum]|uniref:Uncharacterized protein n=1 Tax=Cryptosporangium aurantiacum TaxID=134849 RepID=A0A1M7NJI8_9ACTN|nr:hypothetical protein [Cryptosporangium aurantiacum]SHN04007.1 hypothetical protein SAMN05443668_102678 [Cryptosporangium aurantiacum]
MASAHHCPEERAAISANERYANETRLQYWRRRPTTRLALALAGTAVGLLLVRLIVVLVINSDRADASAVKNIEFSGRYYPIKMVCPLINDDALEKSLGDPALREEGLFATGNGFVADEISRSVTTRCGSQNLGYATDPQVQFFFSATVFAEPVDKAKFPCGAGPGEKSSEGTIGDHQVCRITSPNNAATYVVDDNAVIRCSVEAVDDASIPRMTRAAETQCAEFIDALARARPVSFLGPGFLTVR